MPQREPGAITIDVLYTLMLDIVFLKDESLKISEETIGNYKV